MQKKVCHDNNVYVVKIWCQCSPIVACEHCESCPSRLYSEQVHFVYDSANLRIYHCRRYIFWTRRHVCTVRVHRCRGFPARKIYRPWRSISEIWQQRILIQCALELHYDLLFALKIVKFRQILRSCMPSRNSVYFLRSRWRQQPKAYFGSRIGWNCRRLNFGKSASKCSCRCFSIAKRSGVFCIGM